jgi:hypothetical protein
MRSSEHKAHKLVLNAVRSFKKKLREYSVLTENPCVMLVIMERKWKRFFERVLKRYVYQGVKGNKLESVNINGRYTSKEAIQRFIERKQGFVVSSELARAHNKKTEASLRRHGIIK